MERSQGTTDALPSHACPRASRSAPLPASCHSEDQASGSHSHYSSSHIPSCLLFVVGLLCKITFEQKAAFF